MSRRTLPARRLAAAAIAPLALTTLAACGADDGTSAKGASASTSATVSEGSGDSAAAEVAAAAIGDEIEPDAFAQLLEGSFDGGTAHLVMKSDGAAAGFEAEGDADFTTSPPAMQLSLSGALLQGQAADATIVDGVMYVQLGAGSEQYLRLDLSDPDSPLGSGLTDQLDPRAMVEGFADAITSVVHEGEQDVDGESLDAYAVTVDTEGLLEGAGQDLLPGADAPDQIVYEMFLDADGQFRRLSFGLGESVGEVSLELSDWGQDVTIEAPPEDQVSEFPSGLLPGSSASS